jgi:hypothetical protein
MSEMDYGFSPNFSTTHEVILDYPLSQVYEIIGTSVGHERVTTLSSLASNFNMGEKDFVRTEKTLDKSHLRCHTNEISCSEGEGLPRIPFSLQETVPMVFGLVTSVVHLAGTLTWDEENKLALYETHSDKGIDVWKLRRFEDIEDGKKTKVTETIQGRCPALLSWIVQHEARKAHW